MNKPTTIAILVLVYVVLVGLAAMLIQQAAD
jgi:hypothetical protein